MDTKDILKQKRLELGLTYEELGNLVGVGKSTVRKWETGMIDNMRRDNIIALSKALNVSPTVLMGLDEPKKSHPTNVLSIQSEKFNRLIVYGKVCAGDGIEALENPIDEITNPYHYIKGDLFALQVHGDSMNNIVDDGMYAIVKRQNIIANGEIAVILIDHQLGMLKRFYQYDDVVILRPDSSNPEHQPLTFVGEQINDIKVLGKLIGFVSPLMN